MTSSPAVTGGGGAAGKPTVSDFSIIKQLDSASPKLFEACCQGTQLPAVQMTLAKKGDGQPSEVSCNFIKGESNVIAHKH